MIALDAIVRAWIPKDDLAELERALAAMAELVASGAMSEPAFDQILELLASEMAESALSRRGRTVRA